MARKQLNLLTEEQKLAFDEAVRRWQTTLGMVDWRLERSKKATRNMAEVEIHHKDRLASYRIGDFGAAQITSETIEATALHEVLHVMLCELVNSAEYGIEGEALESAEHRVINALEKTLLTRKAA
jgi:hypothetical protein